MIQGSDEWFSARLGKVTASKVADIMTKTKSGYGASRKNYMGQLLCERLTKKREESYTNSAMMRGTELEPKARAFYELSYSDVVECGLIDHPSIPMFAASPDGLVGDDGLIEIKCPNTMTHIEFILSLKPDSKYITQMQVQMACTGRKWCDFISFDDRLPIEMQFSFVRVDRDNAYIAEIETEVKLFLEELNNLIIKLRGDK